ILITTWVVRWNTKNCRVGAGINFVVKIQIFRQKPRFPGERQRDNVSQKSHLYVTRTNVHNSPTTTPTQSLSGNTSRHQTRKFYLYSETESLFSITVQLDEITTLDLTLDMDLGLVLLTPHSKTTIISVTSGDLFSPFVEEKLEKRE
ncbi:hypothetical protein AVEN_175424-1, partial [Araneus ventricosus]